MLLFSFSLFTGSLRAFIHRVCARPSFFFVARWGDIEKRDNEEKKTRKEGLVHRRVYYKKAQEEEEKEATETRKDKALGERAKRKKER